MEQPPFSDDDNPSKLQKKIYVIADEVLDILKQLSHDNKKQLNSKVIAERMFVKDNVKKMLSDNQAPSEVGSSQDISRLEDITYSFLDKFFDLAPDTLTGEISDLRKQLTNRNSYEDNIHRLDSIIKYIKIYFEALSVRNKELEEFMRQTIKYLNETEDHLSSELAMQQSKFNDDRAFEKGISINMKSIQDEFESSPADISDNFKSLRTAVFSKIENINKGIERKREQDMLQLKETEKILDTMGGRINTIKQEAEEIKKKAEELEQESLRDRLTQLNNRKAYDQKVTEVLANLRRYNVPASLMLCDIDNFKNINDSFGHKVGDLALKKLASLLTEKLRVNDFVARYGGEEFAIILPHTSLEDSIRVGDSVRSYIDDSSFSYKNKNIRLTISIGLSMFRKEDSIDSVAERADSALYLAKHSGKNILKTEEDVMKEGDVLNKEPLSS